MSKWLLRWWHVISVHDTEPIQLSLVGLLFLWGALFAGPSSDFVYSPSMSLLGRYVAEEAWAAFAIGLGTLWGYAFFAGLLPLRTWCALLGVLFWTILAVSGVISAPHTFAWLAFSTFAVQSSWIFLRHGG